MGGGREAKKSMRIFMGGGREKKNENLYGPMGGGREAKDEKILPSI